MIFWNMLRIYNKSVFDILIKINFCFWTPHIGIIFFTSNCDLMCFLHFQSDRNTKSVYFKYYFPKRTLILFLSFISYKQPFILLLFPRKGSTHFPLELKYSHFQLTFPIEWEKTLNQIHAHSTSWIKFSELIQ